MDKEEEPLILSREELEKTLIIYYSEVAKKKIAYVPTIVDRFLHRQQFLFQQLKEKYDVDIKDVINYVFVLKDEGTAE